MNKTLKFCFITTFFPPHNVGGEGMAIYRLANLLAQKGHFVDVFYCLDSYRILQKHPLKGDFPVHPNIKIYPLKSFAGIFSPLLTQQTGFPFFKNDLVKKLKTENYDVIHYHNMSLIGFKTISYGKVTKLFTIHDHWLICPMHALWKFNREVCQKKSCLQCQIREGKPPQLWRYTNSLPKSLLEVDCFIAPSKYILEKLLESGLKIPIKQIPHFLPTNEIKMDLTDEKIYSRPYFLFVGRLNKIKGVQNLIPVFKKLPEFDLLIAGEGEYQETLINLADNSQNIKFLGGVSPQNLKSLYKNATAVVIPSICPETFGLTTIESFAMKTPVIVNNLGALPEIVEKSNAGFIFDGETKLTEAILKLGNNSSLRDELGKNGYAAFLEYWSEDAHLSQYLNLIEELGQQKQLVNN